MNLAEQRDESRRGNAVHWCGRYRHTPIVSLCQSVRSHQRAQSHARVFPDAGIGRQGGCHPARLGRSGASGVISQPIRASFISGEGHPRSRPRSPLRLRAEAFGDKDYLCRVGSEIDEVDPKVVARSVGLLALAAATFAARIIRQGYRPMKKIEQLPPADVHHLMLVFVDAVAERAVVILEIDGPLRVGMLHGRTGLEDSYRACGDLDRLRPQAGDILRSLATGMVAAIAPNCPLRVRSNVPREELKKPAIRGAAIDPERLNRATAQALNPLLKPPDTVLRSTFLSHPLISAD